MWICKISVQIAHLFNISAFQKKIFPMVAIIGCHIETGDLFFQDQSQIIPILHFNGSEFITFFIINHRLFLYYISNCSYLLHYYYITVNQTPYDLWQP